MLYTIGHKANPKAHPVAAGIDYLRTFLSDTLALADSALTIHDGCGLCTYNRLSPRALTTIIAYGYNDDGLRTLTSWAREGAYRQTDYDALGRVDGIIYGDMSLTPQVQIFYTDAGRPDLVDLFSYDFGTSYFYSYDDRLLCTREEIHFDDWSTCAFDEFALARSFDACRRGKGMHVGYDGVDYAQLMRTYDAENRVAAYSLTNSAGHVVNVAFAYDGSRTTGLTYYTTDEATPATFALALTRDAGRPELVTRRDYAFNGSPVYWHETVYDVLGRPTGANDSRTLVRQWLYNRRSELASAQVGANAYGYTYDSIGNRLADL